MIAYQFRIIIFWHDRSVDNNRTDPFIPKYAIRRHALVETLTSGTITNSFQYPDTTSHGPSHTNDDKFDRVWPRKSIGCDYGPRDPGTIDATADGMGVLLWLGRGFGVLCVLCRDLWQLHWSVLSPTLLQSPLTFVCARHG